jgi:nitrogen PTS system EIIA component
MNDQNEESSKARNPSLMLCHYLTPATILIRSEIPDKKDLFHDLTSQLAKVWNLSEVEKLMDAVWEREKEGHTVLESGLAIPHARVSGLDEIKACLGIIPQGYLDPQENVQVRIVFLFLSPQEQFGNHLQMLAQISRIFQDTEFMERLIASKTPEEVFNLIQRQERT